MAKYLKHNLWGRQARQKTWRVWEKWAAFKMLMRFYKNWTFLGKTYQSKSIQSKIWDLKIEGSEGNHGVLEFGGSGVRFRGCFLAPDHMIARWMHSTWIVTSRRFPLKLKERPSPPLILLFWQKDWKSFSSMMSQKGG